MGTVVSLRKVAEEIDFPSSEWTAYLNRKTGEVVVVTDDDASVLEREAEGEELDLPDWQAEMLPELREVTTSEDYLVLPHKEEIDEYRLMERFASGLEDERVSAQLLRAIQGRGAFRYFKDTAREHGLLDAWFDYRQRALEELVAEWCEENGIDFTREG